uniref:Uncharacterized protein n=1 Tax=Glossina brevipalpis TaxID=37001 RepID=A0A1A9WS58_9MUSC
MWKSHYQQHSHEFFNIAGVIIFFNTTIADFIYVMKYCNYLFGWIVESISVPTANVHEWIICTIWLLCHNNDTNSFPLIRDSKKCLSPLGSFASYCRFYNANHYAAEQLIGAIDRNRCCTCHGVIYKPFIINEEEIYNENAVNFNTYQRNILGLITDCKSDSILTDTDYKTMNVRLNLVKINFAPKEGDKVSVCCNVQYDNGFVDKQGEILDQISV